ncbi:3-deoxy-D-manno-octulosonic acid transferase [Fulvivirga sediminis]|uniref:3-deoxy-D-manno-octulosonic acid transferase n=1 Tax=Fulvivirga sediminis TaxID=2803949 RepID=A0A937JYJ5_9BACT|nr:glycosyltransferase N-terminal domain-containing protein [Fulvivirga sediminis]MBL3656483.1 3-deoxy-D-manno-octulosonic acid transferase [Fulvivirga sediminis]
MGKISYRLFIFFYRVFISFAALFNKKAKLFSQGRKNLFQELSDDFKAHSGELAWFHCASLGEFEQGRPVIEAFKQEFPHFKILLTFFSPSGYEVRKDYALADYVYYLPLDTPKNARNLINITKPSIAIFVKYEYWYFYLKALKKNNIPILSVSSIFRKDQIYFKKHGSFYRHILKQVSHFFVQDYPSKELLNKISFSNVTVSGDTRFDRVVSIVNNKKEIPNIKEFKDKDQLMVIGSCWPEDFEVLVSFINEFPIKFIIAPHEIEEKFMQRIEKDAIKKVIRFSKLTQATAKEHDILIIDNVGMLSKLYAYADYAYIGGAFGAGLHNILEAATFGLPIFFGNKNYTKFKEAVDLINLGGAVAIADNNQLRFQFHQFMDERTYNIGSQVNRDYVIDHKGATDKIINHCKEILS